MSYIPGIPLPGDLLSDSQNDIKNNFTAANASFGVDHYAFDNGTVNNGFHDKVTTPPIVGGVDPTTAAGYCKLYALEKSANLGLLQFSRPPSNGTPTPITFLQSSTTAISLADNATTNVLDATGLTLLHGVLWCMNVVSTRRQRASQVYWDGAAWFIFNDFTDTSTSLTFGSSGSTLFVKNNASGAGMSIYWTLQIFKVT